MNTVLPGINTNHTHNDRDGREQFPGNTRVLYKIRFITNNPAVDVLKIVVMNDVTVSTLAANHEYIHSATSVSVESLASFTMSTGLLEGTQVAIDGFVDSMALRITTTQSSTWTCGVYTPSGAFKRLFKAIDPDDSTRMIGVLLEQNALGQLTNITWYKTKDAGVIFSTMPTTLAFEQVNNEHGLASLDPSDIGGWTWYYTTAAG